MGCDISLRVASKCKSYCLHQNKYPMALDKWLNSAVVEEIESDGDNGNITVPYM